MRAHLGTNSIPLFTCLRAVPLITLIHGVHANYFASFPPHGRELLERIQQDSAAAILGIGFARNNVHDNLISRQAGCPGDEFQCPNGLDYCCPGNFTCVGPNICCPGTASGLQPCPGNSISCYVPGSQICCPGRGTCPVKWTCCGAFCCFPWEYCGSDGSCTVCPDTTVSLTTTIFDASVAVATATATQLSGPYEAYGKFSCPPFTTANSLGATLELDTTCVLSYTPPPGTMSAAMTTSSSIAAAGAVARDEMLLGRQAAPSSCSPYQTWTNIVPILSMYTTTTVTETTTITTTVEGFSCPTMAITNTYGNVLSLVSSCSLEFFLTAPASTSTSGSTVAGETSAGASGGSSGGEKSSATSSYTYGLSARWTWAGVVFLELLFL